MSSSVDATVLVQGSAKPNSDGESVTVVEMHKAVVDDTLYVYVPEDVVPLDEAEARRLYASPKKSKKEGA